MEHLANCAENPAIAELFGGLSSEYCLQTDAAALTFGGVGGLFRQAGTIGFLVMSYFFFKRSANGILDWDDLDVDVDADADLDLDSVNGINAARGSPPVRRCPQCNGTGKFEWDGAEASITVCDLCNGTGAVARSAKAGPLGLPMSSRELWRDDGDGDVGDVDDGRK